MKLKLLNLGGLDLGYTNVIDFQTRESRSTYFSNLPGLELDINYMQDSYITQITIPKEISYIRSYDYLTFNYQNKDFYYFITSKDRKTQNTTTLFVTLDVFTTHQFDVQFLDSFVERCHVKRWNTDGTPTRETTEEGLDFGEIIQIGGAEELVKMSDTVIMASSVPMGLLPSSGGGTGGCATEPPNDKISANHKQFISDIFPASCEAYNKYGLFASVGMAQAIEESGWGTSQLAIEANNFYGIKWNVGDKEDYYINPLDGIKYRKYPTKSDGIRARAQFLIDNPRYTNAGVFLAKTPREQIQCIFNAGYAENPSYVDNIMAIINGSNLTIYDILGGGSSEGDGDFNGYKSFDNDFGKGWLVPVHGTVTSVYGPRWGTFHHGTDIGCPTGTEYIASKAGKVTNQGYSNSMGNFIYIDHDGGYRTRVMHLSQILTKLGDTVTRGQIIGKAGSTGDSTGSHAHWEIRRISDNESTNPAPTLKEGDKV